MCGTVAGGFMWFIVRLIARRFMSWSDTTPASNVSGTHSYLAAVRRTDRIPLWHLPEIFMTLQKAKSIARHLGLGGGAVDLGLLAHPRTTESPPWRRQREEATDGQETSSAPGSIHFDWTLQRKQGC